MDKQKKNNSFRFISSLLMIILYLGMPYLLLFTSMFDNMNYYVRLGIGILFPIYGIFRAYRLWKHGK